MLILTVWLLPLIIYNRMMWDFYYPKELLFQVTVAIALVLRLNCKKTKIGFNLLDIVVILNLILPVLFSIFYHHIHIDSLRLPFYSILFYLLIQCIDFHDRNEYFQILLKITTGVFLVGCMVASYGILQYFKIDFLHPRGLVTFGPRVVGTLGHANVMGGYLTLIFPSGIAIIKIVKEVKWKILTGVGLIVITGALILTVSRGAWLALSISLIIFNFRSIKTKWQIIFKNQFISRTAILFFIASVFSIIYWLYNLNPDSAMGRFFIWRIAWRMFSTYPVFGIGFQRFQVEYLYYQADFFGNVKNVAFFSHAANMKQADNEYLQILAENGIVGLLYIIPFLIILYRFWFLWRKNNDSKSDEYILAKVLGISITAIFLHSFVDNPLRNIAIQIIFLFFVGMISQGIKITGNPTTPIISFRNRILLWIAAVVFLGFTIFNVFLKGSAYINWRQGQAYFKAGYYEKSIEKYCRAQRKLPDTGELLFQLGSAYAYTNQPEKALPFLHKSKYTFNDKNIYINEGLCYYRLKDFENAEKSLSTALRMYPELLLPRLWLAEIYLETDRREEALAKLREIHEIQPKNLLKDAAIIKRDARLLQDNILKDSHVK